jgi:hypothetical protein
MTTTPGYRASWTTDGTGHWQVTLPTDCSREDFLALMPVVDAVKAFVEPTINKRPLITFPLSDLAS